MNEQKMREAFADAYAKEVQNDQLTVLAMWSDKDGAFLNAEMQVGWNMWQAATSVTQRDAMAVAEAVLGRAIDAAAEDRFNGAVGAIARLDLAAIVEAVRPVAQEPVNQQLLAALIRCRSFLSDPANFDCYGSEERLAEFLQRVKLEENEAIAQADAAIAAAEAAPSVEGKDTRALCMLVAEAAYRCATGRGADQSDVLRQIVDDVLRQPTSAQQQGEPVAWKCVEPVDLMPRIEFTDVGAVAGEFRRDGWRIFELYTTPHAPASSVPDGSLLLDVGEVEFLAARVRRLCRKFDYHEPEKDDRFVVGVAGSLIGAILTKLDLAERKGGDE